jgi:hypothetical protein
MIELEVAPATQTRKVALSIFVPFAAGFSLVSGHFDRSLIGRASTALNLLVFLGAFVFQWGIGVVIGFWGGANAGAYPAEGYQVAFGSLATLQAMMVFNDRKLAT